jgi:Tol biopolymer transport system component
MICTRKKQIGMQRISPFSMRATRALLAICALSASSLIWASAEPERHGSFPWPSPDGRQVVFASSRGANLSGGKSAWLSMHIFRMDADGSNVHQLTDSSTSDTAPIWSPDGQWIVFGTTNDKANQQTIEVMRPDGTLRHTIITGHFLPWVRISPDSRQIAVTLLDAKGRYSISTASIDGSNQRLLATHLKMAWDGIWAPDGTQFVFAERPPDPETDSGPSKSRIYISKPNGDHRRLLGTFAGFLQVPSWSPDGRSIAYQTYTGNGDADIVVLDVGTGRFRIASQRDRKYLDETPAWLPDGRLLLQSNRNGPFDIYAMNADGTGAKSLTGGENRVTQ